MSTAAIYTILPAATDSGDITGLSFATGRRLEWSFTLRLPYVETGTVQVQVEKAPLDEDDLFAVVHDFTALAQGAEVTQALTLTADDRYIRATVTGATGEFVAELLASAPWLNPDVHAEALYLPKEVREWKDGLTRTVEDAEETVHRLLLDSDSDVGVYEADIGAPDFLIAMRQAISLQAGLILRREELLRAAKDPVATETLEDLPTIAQGVEAKLRRFRPSSVGVWRGR
jgi:hypothetical protein